MEGGSGKSYLLNIIDCPGHVCFNDELTAALRLADGEAGIQSKPTI